jgi:hypothetical protein
VVATLRNADFREAVLKQVQFWGEFGITAKELAIDNRDREGWYHGPISGHLSHLHRDGLIERLVDKRSGFGIYVQAADVNGRDTVPQGRGAA